jgi:hypothetical protein
MPRKKEKKDNKPEETKHTIVSLVHGCCWMPGVYTKEEGRKVPRVAVKHREKQRKDGGEEEERNQRVISCNFPTHTSYGDFCIRDTKVRILIGVDRILCLIEIRSLRIST